jgi:hypothetical protein
MPCPTVSEIPVPRGKALSRIVVHRTLGAARCAPTGVGFGKLCRVLQVGGFVGTWAQHATPRIRAWGRGLGSQNGGSRTGPERLLQFLCRYKTILIQICAVKKFPQ